MASRKKPQAQPVEAVPTTRRPRRGSRLYAGAKVTRLVADWLTSSTSADA